MLLLINTKVFGKPVIERQRSTVGTIELKTERWEATTLPSIGSALALIYLGIDISYGWVPVSNK